MTDLVKDSLPFADETVHGRVAANRQYIQEVRGGVVRSTASPRGEVSLVIGGGSGHFPIFSGWVGPGMAHGAVCGNIFASPSSSKVESVVRAADNGGGTLVVIGNYAGDLVQFGAAAELLGKEGHDVRIVTTSDDIASNTPDKADDRRGIAGDICVVKVAGAAVASGMSLDQAEAVSKRANDRTRSLGVAFSGCTLPGAAEPLFTVEEGTYALGLGIHGEPGLSTHPMKPAAEIARHLIEAILEEEPERGKDGYEGRVTVLVNGLGATTYEELFVLYNTVSQILESRGFTIVQPLVGEHGTSLDMAGASVTVMFLDEELEKLWTAPADTPGYKLGSVTPAEGHRDVAQDAATQIPAGSPESAAQASCVVGVLEALAATARDNEVAWGKLDSVAGDGDHGRAVLLGSTGALASARESVDAGAGIATLLTRAGQAWSDESGGASGGLWGSALATIGSALSDADAATDEQLATAVAAGARSFAATGGAQPGDKTIVDAANPFAEALGKAIASGEELPDAWAAGAAAAATGANLTADLVARKGRAKTHGSDSLGHPDPGATSFGGLMAAAAKALRKG